MNEFVSVSVLRNSVFRPEMAGCNKRERADTVGLKSFLKNHYHFNALAISRDISSSFEKKQNDHKYLAKKAGKQTSEC